MTHLTTLRVEDLRILTAVDIALQPGLNLITGDNASGKSSLIEAIHILGRGRSFRDSQWRAIIREGQPRLRITGRVVCDAGSRVLGFERDATGFRARLGGEPLESLAALVAALPLQLIEPESHRLIAAGPTYRRRYLDWGVFHVEHGFHGAWRRYRRALHQRNALLKAGAGDRDLVVWEVEMSRAAVEIARMREAYVARLEPVLATVGRRLLPERGCSLHYLQGWREGEPLEGVLAAHRGRDRGLGFTRDGPHRADLQVWVDGHRAEARVSRGQQKLLVVALLRAQALLLEEVRGDAPLLLFDDLAAELDEGHRRQVAAELAASGMQVVVTGTRLDEIRPDSGVPCTVFHVEHGRVAPVV